MLPGQNLKCQTPADVYLLLKSSDFISHDLDHAFEDCVDFPIPSPSAAAPRDSNARVERVAEGLAAVDLGTNTAATSEEGQVSEARPRDSSAGTTTTTRPFEFELVLKKWFDMPKSQEWRCFVRQDRLLGESRVLHKSPVASERSVCLAAPKQNAHLSRPLLRLFSISLRMGNAGISQRDTTLYDFLQPEQARTEIRDLIRRFWEESIRDHAPLSNCTPRHSPSSPLSFCVSFQFSGVNRLICLLFFGAQTSWTCTSRETGHESL